jgi:hypothetical protein
MESGGGEQNYWPGFVDVLSNVVLTLIFVLVVFVFALAMASNKVEERMKEVEEAEQKQSTSMSAVTEKHEASQKTIQELQQELQKTQAELEQIKSAQSKEEDVGKDQQKATSNIVEDHDIAVIEQQQGPEDHQGSVNLVRDEGTLTLTFPQSVSALDDQSQIQLEESVKKLQALTNAKKILIRSYMSDEAYSAARRVAYYRALNVRNFLLTKLGVPSSAISSVIVETENLDEGRVEIIFKAN